MQIKRFNIHTDLDHINEWLINRKMPAVTRHDMPEMGYIARHEGMPVGAIFLRRCEGGVGIVDSLVSNPKVDAQVRDFAMNELIKHIIEQAKRAKITRIFGMSVDENTLLRSVRLGFTQTLYAVVALDLSKLESK